MSLKQTLFVSKKVSALWQVSLKLKYFAKYGYKTNTHVTLKTEIFAELKKTDFIKPSENEKNE